MIKVICDECKKVIEGYTQKQANWMLEQHKLTHKLNKGDKHGNQPTE